MDRRDIRHWDAEAVPGTSSQLGEGPCWDAARGVLFWIDIPGQELHRFDPATGSDVALPLAVQTGCIVPTAGGGYIAGTARGFERLDPDTAELTLLCDPEPDTGNRFNDGKASPDGAICAGTISSSRLPDASFYRMDPGGNVAKLFDGITNSNGLVWDLTTNTFYYIDTPTGRIDAFDYDPVTGALSNRRVAFAITEELGGYPDGMTIDAEGKLWVAHFGSWKISRWDPATASVIGIIDLPVQNITCCAFGGPDLDTLYITTASLSLSETERAQQPLAGSLFTVRPGVTGSPPDTYDGTAR